MNSKTIKSLLIFLPVFILSAIQVKGQVIPKLGVKGGLNITTITNSEEDKFKPGLTAGAFLNINIPLSPFAVQPEVLYSQYGVKSENSGEEFKLDYIQVPVLLKVQFSPPLSLAKPNIYAGPYLGFNTSAKVTIDSQDEDLDQLVRDTEIGVAAGLGLDVLNARFDLRYTIGVTPAYEDNFEDGERNMGISFTVGIAF